MAAQSQSVLTEIFNKLRAYFGPMPDSPGSSPLEKAIGVILEQHGSRSGTEQALKNLKTGDAAEENPIVDWEEEQLAARIQPAGSVRRKVKALRGFLAFLKENFAGHFDQMSKASTDALRQELVAVKGISRETADSILLRALGRPVFPVDLNVYRVLTRHHLAPEESGYDELQEILTVHLPEDPAHFREFQGLFEAVGKEFCRPQPLCEKCPLNGVNWTGITTI